MRIRLPLLTAGLCSLSLAGLVVTTNKSSASNRTEMPRNSDQPPSSSQQRDEKLWRRALEIQRKAIVIDTHNDVTTPMTNDDYDLSGTPPTPYRTSIERMKQGGMTAEFFSLYVKPWYVDHGGAGPRTPEMIDLGFRPLESPPKQLMFSNLTPYIKPGKRGDKKATVVGV